MMTSVTNDMQHDNQKLNSALDVHEQGNYTPKTLTLMKYGALPCQACTISFGGDLPGPEGGN